MDRSTQLEEIDSLKNIYYSEEFQVLESSDHRDKIQAIFWAFFTLPDYFQVKYLESVSSEEPSYLKVKHLPPIELRLTLPIDYPSKNPPEFVISCKWLHKSMISKLCKKLDDIWLECGPVEILYSWCDFLKNDSLTFLGCDKELDLTSLCLKHLTFIQKLKRNEEKKQRWREKNTLRFRGNKSRATEASGNSTRELSAAVENGNDTCDPSKNSLEASGSSTHTLSEAVENGNKTHSLSMNSVDNLKGFKDKQNKSQQRHPYCRAKYKMKNKSSNPKKTGNRFDERAVLDLILKMSPLKVLENYNTEREKVEFLRNFYTCNICFSDKMGKDCTQFKDCKHVFCRNCIRSYFTVRIKDGTVQSIKCPEEKCTTEALPSQVKEIVSEELFAKYDSVLLSTALDTLTDIIYCPRPICQYPVSWDPEERMASCPNCQYVFCVTCKMVYHGVEPCQFKAGEVQKLVEQYESASVEVRRQMETKYGKKHLESLVNNTKAEAWIKENSKACPRCEAAIEKSQGCNKMVCWKCNASFCWLCCEILDSKDPYSHFRDPQSRCVNKLFHLVHDFGEEDEDDDDWDWVDDSEEDLSDLENFYFYWEEEYFAMFGDEFHYV